MVQPEFENLTFCKDLKTFSQREKVECRVSLGGDAPKKVLSVFAQPLASSCSATDGEFSARGKVVFFACYVDSENAVKKAEGVGEYEFTVKDECAKSKTDCRINASVEKCDYFIDGDNLLLSASVNVNVKSQNENCADIVKDGERTITNKSEIEYEKSLGVSRGAYPVEQAFTLPYSVEEVLCQSGTVSVTATQCGVGCVIVDGEVYLSCLLLQNGQKRDIIREEWTLPFRFEAQAEWAMPSMRAVAFAQIKSISNQVAVDDDGESNANVSVILEYDAEVFADEIASITVDAFSLDDEIEIEKIELPTTRTLDAVCLKERVFGRAETTELPIGARILAVSSERVEIVKHTCSGKQMEVDGILTCYAFYRDGDNELTSAKLEIPFSVNLKIPCEAGGGDITAIVSGVSAKIVSATQTEVCATVIFTVYPKTFGKVACVKNYKVIGSKSPDDSAISVYIPLAGEGLWDLAKRLSVRPEALVKSNPELNFPLTGKERIVIYRNL